MKKLADKLIEQCAEGRFDPLEVLTNVLTNYMSIDDANDFAKREYGIEDDEESDDCQ